MSRLILASLLLLPAAASAQEACEVDPPECELPAAQGSQPCTFEARRIFEDAASGLLGPAGPPLPQLRTGCAGGAVGRGQVPCQILKAFGWIMTGWRQFCTADCGHEGPTSVGWGCRYGIFQVPIGDDGFDVGRAAAEAPYNVGAGALRLAREWSRTPCIGARQPQVAEHWYFAVWAADAFTYANNPNNPAFPLPRPEYGSAQGWFDRGSYPLQEVVFGVAQNPPIEDSTPVWRASPLTLPQTQDICGTAGCAPGDIDAPAEVHGRDCPAFTPPGDGGAPDASSADAGDGGSEDAGTTNVPTAIAGCDCDASATDASGLSGTLFLATLWLRPRRAGRSKPRRRTAS